MKWYKISSVFYSKIFLNIRVYPEQVFQCTVMSETKTISLKSRPTILSTEIKVGVIIKDHVGTRTVKAERSGQRSGSLVFRTFITRHSRQNTNYDLDAHCSTITNMILEDQTNR